jgi:hypothetical protein
MDEPKFIYKLTDQNLQTYYGFQYKRNRWVKVLCDSYEPLCTQYWLHAYEHPYLAVLLNPIHAQIRNARLFECKWRGKIKNKSWLKLGVSEIILKRELELPVFTDRQKRRFLFRFADFRSILTAEEKTRWQERISGEPEVYRTHILACEMLDAARDGMKRAEVERILNMQFGEEIE